MDRDKARERALEELDLVQTIVARVLEGREVSCEKCGTKLEWVPPYVRCDNDCTLIHVNLGVSPLGEPEE